MKKTEIKIGGKYIAKVSNKIVTVKVDDIKDDIVYSGMRKKTLYYVTNLATGRKITFNSAAKFRSEVPYRKELSYEELPDEIKSIVPKSKFHKAISFDTKIKVMLNYDSVSDYWHKVSGKWLHENLL